MSAGGPELVVRVSANLTELKQALTEGVTQFETTRSALNQMSNAFDGSRTLAQAGAVVGAILQIGDVTKLTAAEQAKANTILEAGLAKYQALGREAPPGMRELAAATKQNEESTFNWSGALGKASGILAGLGITASVAGLVMLTRAMFDDADALEKMHDKTDISVEGLQAMRIAGDDAGVSLESMTNAVNMLQKRLGGDDESANKALRDLGINIDTFRKMDGAQQMDALSKSIQGIEDPLRVAHDLSGLFGKQWAEMLPVLKRGFSELETGSGQMSAGTVKALDDAGDALGRFYRSAKANLGEALADVLTLSLSSTRALNAEIAKLPIVVAPDQMKNFWGAVVPPGLPKDLDAIEAGFRKDAQAIKDLAELTKVMSEIEKTTFGLAMDHEKQWREEIQKTLAVRNRTVTEGLSEIQKAEKDLADFEAKQALDTLSYQILKIWQRVDEEEAAFKGSEQQRASYNKAVEALATEEAQALRDASDSTIIAAAKAAEASEAAASRQVKAIETVTQGYYREVDAAMAALAAASMLDSSSGSRTSTPNDGSMERGPGINQGATVPINGINASAMPLFKNASLKSFDVGGPTGSGGPAMLHPDEYVVPKGGALVSGGGGSTVVNIYVTQPLGTPAAIASAVDQALTSRLKNTGQRF